MIQEYDTIAAIATAVSNAGIGVIRISGEKALDILEKIFCPYDKKKKVSHLKSHHIYVGTIMDGDIDIDECIVLIMKGPHSYTREDVVEIDCHGGISVISRILNLVLSCGARPAEPGEFTKRAFLNGRIDLSQAEAVMDLIEAKNEQARINSVTQLKGSLSQSIREIRDQVLYQVAYIESALDDPEHIDLNGYKEQLTPLLEQWIIETKKLSDSYDEGRFISEGIRTCIVGKPNAGKSSFLNRLVGEERAIVTEVAGTTRDTLEECINIGGITLNIVDTAGIRKTDDCVEKIGVERAKKEMSDADLILYIADISTLPDEDDYEILRQIKGRNKIILYNKCDVEQNYLSQYESFSNYLDEENPVLLISAKYNKGFDEFIAVLKNRMFHGKIEENHDIYITNARHKKALEDALESFSLLQKSISEGLPEDFYTIDMMNAYERLGYILGEAVDEDLINEIFSEFCTGK